MTLFLSFVRHNGILWLNDGTNKNKMELQGNIDIIILLRFVQKTINTLLSKTLSINKLYYFFFHNVIRYSIIGLNGVMFV